MVKDKEKERMLARIETQGWLLLLSMFHELFTLFISNSFCSILINTYVGKCYYNIIIKILFSRCFAAIQRGRHQIQQDRLNNQRR